jgi:hypothetical protein
MATTTPNYGWDVPTSTDYVKDGATAIETLGDDIDATLYTALGGAYPGLRLVKKQTIGSAVSSVTVTGAFSATYDNYKIIVSGGQSSVAGYVTLTLGATTTNYYAGYVGFTYAATTSNAATSNGAGWFNPIYANGTKGLNGFIDLINPFGTNTTYFSSQVAAINQGVAGQGLLDNATSYTDFKITPASGTLTGGTIYVYGYGAS